MPRGPLALAALPRAPELVWRVPGSKSITNRALICAALVDGTSEIVGVAPGDDTTALIACLEALGCSIRLRHTDEGTRADVVGTGRSEELV